MKGMFEYDPVRVRRWKEKHTPRLPPLPEEKIREVFKKHYDEVWARRAEEEKGEGHGIGVARKGQVSTQISVRFPAGVLDSIDRDLAAYDEHTSRTEFIVEASKHYLAYRVEMKLKESALRADAGRKE